MREPKDLKDSEVIVLSSVIIDILFALFMIGAGCYAVVWTVVLGMSWGVILAFSIVALLTILIGIMEFRSSVGEFRGWKKQKGL